MNSFTLNKTEEQMIKKSNYSLIPYNSCFGAQIKGCKDGPIALKLWGLERKLKDSNLNIKWDLPLALPPPLISEKFFKEHPSLATLTTHKHAQNLPLVIYHCQELYKRIQDSLSSSIFPIVIGGDHSMGIGTWSGVVDYHQCHENFGLIWIDAHLDAHTLESSPSKAFHGMPIASLLGLGEKKLSQLGSPKTKISPKHLCFIGIRSYEDEEYSLIKKLGAHIITAEEVSHHGLKKCLSQALTIVKKAKGGFGVSLDLDFFDPTVAPGVGSPEYNGISKEEGLDALKNLVIQPKLKALEISEYNPKLDKNHQTAQLVFELLKVMLTH
jgi:arginase